MLSFFFLTLIYWATLLLLSGDPLLYFTLSSTRPRSSGVAGI